jgi:hypothetical protein
LAETAIDDLPGYRRRLRVTPVPGAVMAELEDDMHCMAVTLRHAGGVVTEVEAEQPRAPWTTCPGAVAQVEQTFTGLRLADFAAQGGQKTANCTHLYDLAQLAAGHAGDAAPTVFDILVSDPVEGRRTLELRRDGARVLIWEETDRRFTAPAELAGQSLLDMRAYQAALDPGLQEAARLLRWAGMVAHGRTMPLEEQSDATRLPPNCFTFQPDRARQAKRVGEIRDFSTSSSTPLDRRPAPVLEDGGRTG